MIPHSPSRAVNWSRLVGIHGFTGESVRMSTTLRFRQIHLDFHTSPLIPDVGRDFDPQGFADTFRFAHADSVTVFGKCHHGMCYYPSKVGPVHPSLDFDLMGGQIEALHKVGIKAPIYL